MTHIAFNGFISETVTFIVSATAFSLIVLGAFTVWSWLITELLPKVILTAEVWRRFTVFLWYYNRGLKEKLSRLNEEYDNWVDINVQQPERGQRVIFVVISCDEHYNGKVYGGSYLGYQYGVHDFAIPGISFTAKWWQPLPEPPKSK